MPLLGAHVSVAGGLPLAVDRAAAQGCDALQIFTKSSNQWRARPLPPDEIRDFRERLERAGIGVAVAHASYLINLASSDPVVRGRSLASLGEEIDRVEALGLLGLVIHPGCATTGTVEEGLRLIAAAVREALRPRRGGRALVILEQTAGQGRTLGWRFEQIARILEHLDGHRRVAVCLDTCHLVAAGYGLATAAGYSETFRAFDRLVGLDRLRVFHVNDSKRPIGSRVDRHDHIGRGHVGRGGFARLVNDRRFATLPMLLETPKTGGRTPNDVAADPLDAMNLAALRSLLRSGTPCPRRATS
ncbi:MAG: nfo [Acidobacteria bacterium]|nr:nfo [Acidobacteriota bacterium]